MLQPPYAHKPQANSISNSIHTFLISSTCTHARPASPAAPRRRTACCAQLHDKHTSQIQRVPSFEAQQRTEVVNDLLTILDAPESHEDLDEPVEQQLSRRHPTVYASCWASSGSVLDIDHPYNDDTCEDDWDGLADQVRAWDHLLEAEPAPLDSDEPLHLFSYPLQPDTSFPFETHNLVLQELESVQDGLQPRAAKASVPFIWSQLLEAAASEDRYAASILGAVLYGLGDTVSQVLYKPSEFSGLQLIGIMALGVVMEGLLNPWWSGLIKRKLANTPHVDPNNVRALEIFLTGIVWTPLCCEFYFAYLHVFAHGGLDLRECELILDGVLGSSIFIAGDSEEASGVLKQVANHLLGDYTGGSLISFATNAVVTLVPAPFRPLLKKLSEAGSWTLMG